MNGKRFIDVRQRTNIQSEKKRRETCDYMLNVIRRDIEKIGCLWDVSRLQLFECLNIICLQLFECLNIISKYELQECHR